jgi:ABC-type Fe3+-siderophore transport system permease subunit
MDSIIYILFVSISVPIMLMALLVEKKSRLPIIFILVGIFVSVFASEINGFLVVKYRKIHSMEGKK